MTANDYSLPIETGRWSNSCNERLCNLYNSPTVGHGFHNLFRCEALRQQRILSLPELVSRWSYLHQLQLLFPARKAKKIIKLSKYINILHMQICGLFPVRTCFGMSAHSGIYTVYVLHSCIYSRTTLQWFWELTGTELNRLRRQRWVALLGHSPLHAIHDQKMLSSDTFKCLQLLLHHVCYVSLTRCLNADVDTLYDFFFHYNL